MAQENAFETEEILLNDTAAILSGSIDPSSAGEAAPIGSLYLRDTGQHYKKTGGADTAWSEQVSSDDEDPHAEETFTQATHGFVVGNVLRYDAGAWVLAQADVPGNSEAMGMVSAVPDVNNFTITYSGRINGLSSLTVDTVYFLSPTVAGAFTATDPVSPLVSKPIFYATSTTSGIVQIMRGVSTTAADTTIYRFGHTYAITGEIIVPSGDDAFVLPFNVSLATGQTAAVVKCRYSINSGTSVTCKLQKNGVDLTGFTGITVTTTPASTDPADQAVVDDDELALVVTAVAGLPKNLSFTIFIENTQAVS
jgi:hypothetical protein